MDGASLNILTQRMANAGFNDVATSIGLKLLERKRFISIQEVDDYNGFTYNQYVLTKEGEDFVLNNTHLFDTKQKKKEDELPF
jgi:hypothetical protein